MNKTLKYLDEPKLTFGYGQATEDPRDGLSLFGPVETFSQYSIQAGVVGTTVGIQCYKEFVSQLQTPILSPKMQRPSYPGFESIFGIKWTPTPALTCTVDAIKLKALLKIRNLRNRTYSVVNMYLNLIKDALNNEQTKIDIWFVVIPRDVWLKCRPKSFDKQLTKIQLAALDAYNAGQGILIKELEVEYQQMTRYLDTSSDFHNQLKARLLQDKVSVPIQIILEPTLRFRDKYKNWPFKDHMRPHLAWTQSSTVYYKLGKLPWKLNAIRKGVCYVGLVFKRLQGHDKTDYACSAAQMFLDSGDGTIFKGNNGPWLGNSGQYHLKKSDAKDLLTKALTYYRGKMHEDPAEVFIHGRASFSGDEWDGFKEAVQEFNNDTKLVGISIRESGKIKLFRDVAEEDCRYGNLRGLALIINEKEGFLWTRGFVPRLNTSMSLEIPNPLRIVIDKEDGNIEQVLEDILALTKLNYNACIYGDGLPVTLRFSDMIGGILTAVDKIDTELQPFKFYI